MVVFIFINSTIFFNLSVIIWANGKYSNFAFSTTPGLYPKSSPVKYSYFSNSPDDNVEILSASLSKSYWA